MKNILKIKLPPEFLELCEHDGIEPKLVIHGFIADLCALYGRHGDDYITNGSDERDMARAYYERVGYPWFNRPFNDEGA